MHLELHKRPEQILVDFRCGRENDPNTLADAVAQLVMLQHNSGGDWLLLDQMESELVALVTQSRLNLAKQLASSSGQSG